MCSAVKTKPIEEGGICKTRWCGDGGRSSSIVVVVVVYGKKGVCS